MLEDAEMASEWARKAVDAAIAADKAKAIGDHAPRKFDAMKRSAVARRGAKVKKRPR